jgi:hypothetical protein
MALRGNRCWAEKRKKSYWSTGFRQAQHRRRSDRTKGKRQEQEGEEDNQEIVLLCCLSL